MPFNSPLFLFIYAPLVMGISAALRSGWRLEWLLAASLVFYAWGEPAVVWVVLASAVADYLLVRAMVRQTTVRAARWCLILAIAQNLGLLFWFKYIGLVNILREMPGFGLLKGLPLFDIVLPLGISFFVFEKITYPVDVWRKVTLPAENLRRYLFFVFFFPKLVAGPIVKFHEIRDQMSHPVMDRDSFSLGLERFMLGLARKVLIADVLAAYVDQVFSAPAGSIGMLTAWLGALAFTVQIYCDFAGYSDMAIGLALMLGFRLRENFNQPYLAVGFTDFWRRWHISLSTWIREYLYIPLGGNRCSPARVFFNLWICFVASGLWHGASWTFLVWGAFHGVFVSADHFGLTRVWARLPRFAGIGVTFLLVVIGWVFFRATSMEQALGLLQAMAGFGPGTMRLLPDALQVTVLAVGLAAAFVPLPWLQRVITGPGLPWFGAARLAGLTFLMLWSFGAIFAATFQPFIYFRF
jgi:alginate O-acetyltransferase complex protein AlgI